MEMAWTARRKDSMVPYGSPFDLMDEMDRLFEGLRNSLWEMTPGWGWMPSERMDEVEMEIPAVDVMDTGKAVEITVDLPGMDKDDVEITVDEDSVVVKAETREDREEKGKNYYRRERGVRSFYRRIPLPVPVDTDGGEADMRNGVLHISLPKKEAETRGRRLKIK
ncbi:MAG: Hsp20/alpha crystallin family protein [Thermoplasmata archaeon]|nr:Hsp20/alpha crystallin family protein [Thermoplasmata archaeon]